MNKALKDKAIDIKGKQYVLVSDRVLYFNDTYKNGSIRTELVSDWSSDYIVVKATVIPDVDKPEQYFTGYSQTNVGEGMVNKTAALENAETSAIGRALGMMGIGVLESIASADEMKKTTHGNTRIAKYATEKQIKWIRDTAREVNDQLREDSEVDEFVKDILTITPPQVPIFKVKDAVDKLKDWKKQASEELVAAREPKNFTPDTVIEDIPDGPINLDDIPY